MNPKNDIERKIAEIEKAEKNFKEWEINGFKKDEPNIVIPNSISKFIENVEKSHVNPNLEGLRKDIQIAKAYEYMKTHEPKNGSEPSEAWCIINELLRIIDNMK